MKLRKPKNIYKRGANLLAAKPVTNPFNRAQARDFTEDELEKDFLLTSQYLDTFQNRHQVLLGTRGSGRTILLRMMGCKTRSFLKRTLPDDPEVQELPDATVAFYVRMALEWVAIAMSAGTDKLKFFQTAFNFRACAALCSEIHDLILSRDERSLVERAELEQRIVVAFVKAWGLPFTGVADLTKLAFELEEFAQDIDPDVPESLDAMGRLSRGILYPIETVADRLSELLLPFIGKSVRFYACIDEAEFLPPEFLASIATAMRSSKKCIIKLATLHYHFSDKTLVEGVRLSLGNDYSVLKVDPTPKVFERIADHLVRVRLEEIGLLDQSLASFLGVAGQDRPIDYFALVMKQHVDIDGLHDQIFHQLTEKRKQYVLSALQHGVTVKNTIDLKFAPVFYVREVRKKYIGNKKPGFYGGAANVRLLSNSNPRRFLEIMELLFDRAREHDLGFGAQQDVLMKYSQSLKDRAGGISPILQVFLDVIGSKLAEKVHDGDLTDTGCSFVLSDYLATVPELQEALKQGVAYGHIVPADEGGALWGLPERMCIAYSHAIRFWLPLRLGVPAKITTGNVDLGRLSAAFEHVETGAIGRKAAKSYVKQLQLSLTFDDDVLVENAEAFRKSQASASDGGK